MSDPKINTDGTPSALNGPGSRLLSPVVRSQVLAALQRGATRAIAATYAGISYETLRHAHARGRAEDSDPVWRDLYLAIEKAEADCAMIALEHVGNAMADHFQAATWLLERTRPHEYGKQVTEIIIGDKKVTGMSPEEHEELILTYITGRLKDLGRDDLAAEVRKALK